MKYGWNILWKIIFSPIYFVALLWILITPAAVILAIQDGTASNYFLALFFFGMCFFFLVIVHAVILDYFILKEMVPNEEAHETAQDIVVNNEFLDGTSRMISLLSC